MATLTREQYEAWLKREFSQQETRQTAAPMFYVGSGHAKKLKAEFARGTPPFDLTPPRLNPEWVKLGPKADVTFLTAKPTPPLLTDSPEK